MRIDKIILSNFRIYAGRNEMAFQFNEEKNISLIAGKNGFGKTTFLTGLIWGMYGSAMEQVEEKYQRDIKTAGGYNAFLKKMLNNNVRQKFTENPNSTAKFYVQIELEDVMIPSIPCKKVIITRLFDFAENKEELSILIDGQENELTKEVGYDVFINDFILPREIAKFFFFDAEKIVTLAEAKTKAELKSLSKAYSEVLGIKKYEDLKSNLTTLLSKLKRKGVSKKDQDQLKRLEVESLEIKDLVSFTEHQLNEVKEVINNYRTKIESLQERLIREGNDMTLDELNTLKERREDLKENLEELRREIKSFMEYLPLAIASKRMEELVNQVKLELSLKKNKIDRVILEEEMNQFEVDLKTSLHSIIADKDLLKSVFEQFSQLKESRITQAAPTEQGEIFLDFEEEASRKIISTYEFINHSFKPQFNKLVQQEKEIKQELSRISKRIKEGEARKGNPVSVKLLEEKLEVEGLFKQSEAKQSKLLEELGGYKQKEASINKVLSELLKSTTLFETDQKKYNVTIELLEKINELIHRIKDEKKYSLQKSIQLGLQKLMHKKDKIQDVKVRIDEDEMDIDLIDEFGNVIDKEDLSKGEQQLYATALLKALVDESGIHFPVFIDSPLQKFDMVHSSNVIQQFYPSISEQVVLFPLLEKELSKDEYQLLLPHLNSVHLIENKLKGSSFVPCKIDELFTKFHQQHVLSH